MKKTLITMSLLAVAATGVAQENDSSAMFENGVVINGVRWATRNVDMPGTFVATPEDFGKYYQWNSDKARVPMEDVFGPWDSGEITGPSWTKGNDPSPIGWRLPTKAEFDALGWGTWTKRNGITGYEFRDGTNRIFLPAADQASTIINEHYSVDKASGYYWSQDTDGDEYAWFLSFDRGGQWIDSNNRHWGLSVRCVSDIAEVDADTVSVDSVQWITRTCMVEMPPAPRDFADENSDEAQAYFTSADDWSYYISELRKAFERVGVPHVTATKRFLRFALADSTFITIDTQAQQGGYGVSAWIYKQDKLPMVAPIANGITDTMKDYLGELATPSPEFVSAEVDSLKNNTMRDLREKLMPRDEIISNFLTAYDGLVSDYGDVAFQGVDYDSIYNVSSQIPTALEKRVKAAGFNIDVSEGTLFIIQNTDLMKSIFLPLVNKESKIFINLYCREIDDRSTEDAGIIISPEELVNRVYDWGELLSDIAGLKYENIVKDYYVSNLNLLFYGLDNTPAFDYLEGNPEDDSKRYYSKENVRLMDKVIKEHPKSRAAAEFTSYLKLLRSVNFEYTEEVRDFEDGQTYGVRNMSK